MTQHKRYAPGQEYGILCKTIRIIPGKKINTPSQDPV